MTHEKIAMISMLIAQALALYALWLTKKESDHWRTMWLRDATELLYWKRNGILRDPLTGKYRKKDKR